MYDSIVVIPSTCQKLTLYQSVGLFDLSGLGGVREVYQNDARYSNIDLSLDFEDSSNVLVLSYLHVHRNTVIQNKFKKINFTTVRSTIKITIPVTETTEYINVSQSMGYFNIVGLVNIELNFEGFNTIFCMKQGDDLLITLHLIDCEVENRIEVKFKKYRMELYKVHFKNVIYCSENQLYSDLAISHCTGTLDLSGKFFNRMEVAFVITGVKKLFLKGPIYLNYLILSNIPKEVDYLQEFLAQFHSVKYLKIECSFIGGPYQNLEHYFTKEKRATLSRLLQENSDPNDNNRLRIEESILNQEADRFLAVIFEEWTVMARLKRLFYYNVHMSNRNYWYVQKLPQLQILSASMENLTHYSFLYPLISLRSLDLSGSTVDNVELPADAPIYDALMNLVNLKVLIIEGKYYENPAYLFCLPQSLEVLMISYYEINFGTEIPEAPMIKLQLLYITLLDTNLDEWQSFNEPIRTFINGLLRYIDRMYLMCLVVEHNAKLYQVDPLGLSIVYQWDNVFDLGFFTDQWIQEN
ncbi:putative LRR containing protein [Trachipleistophora hominis]|uniref:Putative LRR containing protein n=1 Tax=Trachipleistophora hominis TaxID=72359 RepID=L7JX43_TRAHO|nr:putative LRR containing protein [Trachipleistophora hominis]